MILLKWKLILALNLQLGVVLMDKASIIYIYIYIYIYIGDFHLVTTSLFFYLILFLLLLFSQ